MTRSRAVTSLTVAVVTACPSASVPGVSPTSTSNSVPSRQTSSERPRLAHLPGVLPRQSLTPHDVRRALGHGNQVFDRPANQFLATVAEHSPGHMVGFDNGTGRVDER